MRLPTTIIKIGMFMNWLTCGPQGYSMCARFYENKMKGVLGHSLIVSIIDTMFWFDPDHCRRAYLLRRKTNV